MKRKIFYILLILQLAACNNKEKLEIETTKVQQGKFVLDITEEGEIDATNAITISSPVMSRRFGQLEINMIIEDGTVVKVGDTVIIFDPTEVIKSITSRQSELEIAEAELNKLKATHESEINDLEANLKITEISHQISEINFEQASYEADVTKKEIKLTLEKAKISLDKAREEIKNKKKIHKEEVQQSLLEIKQLRAELKIAQETLNKLTVTSPAPGIAIIKHNWSTNNKWAAGDQTWSGNALIDLPDLSELMARVNINEVDIANIKLNQKAKIKLDAFSDTTFQGKVTKVANLASLKDRDSKTKVFPVEILIEGTSDILIPGMTVSCNISINELENKIYIPLESLFTDGINEYVYEKSGAKFRKKNITTGLSNNDHIIVEEGLNEGDIIALTNPNIDEEDQEKTEQTN